MGLKSRKSFVWLVSFSAVLIAYVLYLQLSERPPIEISSPVETTDKTVEFDKKVGIVGDVGIGEVKMARFPHYNEQQQIDRETGFEKVRHKQGDEWEVEKPYMNIFRDTLKCYITADEGNVRFESAVSGTSPKDATFTGNVVIHILPEQGSSVQESFIYLDDITYISERSQFSTAGPVKFVSKDAQMLGRGLEFVYNDEANRLEYLRITHLDTLRLKTSPERSSISPSRPRSAASAEKKSQKVREVKPKPHTTDQKTPQKAAQNYYRCLFSENVTIEGPQQVVFADELFINNIVSDKKSEVPKSNAGVSTGKADTSRQDKASPKGPPLKPLEQPEQESVDIIITCDDGIFITLMDSTITHRSKSESDSYKSVTQNESLESADDFVGRDILIAQKIDYDYSDANKDITATGPSKLIFYPEGVFANEADPSPVPVKITSQEKASFMPTLNKATFEGDCLCTMSRKVPNLETKYTLSGPKFTVNLSSNDTGKTDLEHFTADGGVVQLDSSKWQEGKLLGFTKLKCPRFDYDRTQQVFSATGPGLIAVDNSKAPEPEAATSRFNLQGPCYVIVQDFDTLEYFFESNRIVADSDINEIFIGYVPIVNGQYGQETKVTATCIEAMLEKTEDGRNKLSNLKTTGGITYEDQDKQFVGSSLFYSADRSILIVQGNEFQPCLLNGAIVNAIQYDLKKDRVKTKITAPGIIQMKR